MVLEFISVSHIFETVCMVKAFIEKKKYPKEELSPWSHDVFCLEKATAPVLNPLLV